MWKWTDEDDIKVIILDIDSLDESVLKYDFRSIHPNIVTCFVSKNDIDEEICDFYYYDSYELLNKIMKKYDSRTYSIISISGNSDFIKEMMKYRIGTIFYENSVKKDFKSLSDFTLNSITDLKQIFDRELIGYAAEAYALGKESYRKKLIHFKDTVSLNNGNAEYLQVFIGGRYYPNSRNYFKDDPLSSMLRKFKWNYISIIDNFYHDVVKYLNNSYEIDLITYIPIKENDKNQRFDRFESLNKTKNNELCIDYQNILINNTLESQKGLEYAMRKENVSGKYELIQDIDIEGKTIVVLDDLYTSGSTLHEVAKVLYEHKAKLVIGITLAINQTIESSAIEYTHLTCPMCEGYLKVIPNFKKGKLFFGCSNYTLTACTGSMKLSNGIKKLKHINALDIVEITDIDDEY